MSQLDTTYYVSNSLRLLIHKFGAKPIFEVHGTWYKNNIYSIFSALSIDVGYFVAQASKVQHLNAIKS